MSNSATFNGLSPGNGGFPTTHWSVVINARAGSEPQAHAALETLCRQYWYPLYSFIRRQGRAHHEAQDFTQEFLARLLNTGGMETARQERGRFRTYLLTALRNFLTNEWHRAHTAKRGGGETPLSLDFQHAENAFHHDPPDPALTPEQEFDRAWALGMIERATVEMQEDYERTGRGVLFAALAPLVWNDDSGENFSVSAVRLGLTTEAFTVALHRLRRRVGQRLRANVSETVARDTDVDEELRHLIAALSAQAAAR
jgi:DNA-directed RNA polymerase specialized sigma24 family protein